MMLNMSTRIRSFKKHGLGHSQEDDRIKAEAPPTTLLDAFTASTL